MKRNIRLKSLFLAVFMAAFAVSAVAIQGDALFWTKDKASSAAMATFSKSGGRNDILTFQKEDFTNRTSSGAVLEGIVISALPEEGKGVLMIDGREALRGDGIRTDDLDLLKFIPSGNEEDTNTSFSFIPVFRDKNENYETITVSMRLSEKKNEAPAAQDLHFETYPDIAVSGELKGTDPEGESLSFKIIDSPILGEVVCDGASFRYQPHQTKTGSDAFTYVATDSAGNSSAPAKVVIDIKKRSGKSALSYVDMKENGAHYPAIKLSEAGIITGENIGGVNFFYPDKEVTRAEFTAMAVTAAKLSVPTAALGTGMKDDGAIPIWYKAHIASAVNSAFVQGSEDSDGNRVFRADDAITRAEAVVVINNYLNLSDSNRDALYTDVDEIPAWAIQAAVNIDATSVVDTSPDGALRPSDKLTRKEAASMLYEAMKEKKKSSEKTGLFSWAKD